MNHRQLTLTEADHNAILTLCSANPALVQLLKQASFFTPSTQDQRAAAMNIHYNGDELEIDDNAGISRGDDGYWVQAWVWVPAQEDDDA